MKIAADVLGATAGPLVQTIDARWLMAYAASLGETSPEYLDTLRPGGILPHPLFPVCYEWPVMLELRARVLADAVALRSVHATHELWIHRLPRPGERLLTTAAVIRLEPRPPGAYLVSRLSTTAADGELVTTTDYGSLYRGVECDGVTGGPAGDRTEEVGQGRGDRPGAWAVEAPVAATLAHVYSECARIWNPIHTDRAVAREAGLPDIILHGTATLALAVSAVLRHHGVGPSAVRGLRGRFSGMVPMPSVLTVRGPAPEAAQTGRRIAFEVLSADGRPAVRQGLVEVTVSP